MNSHLNVFKTYTRENREHQLENDLTRALAISMQEDALFFHELLRLLLHENTEFENIFSTTDAEESKLTIDIQVNAKSITGCQQIIAASLSDFSMTDKYFWEQTKDIRYDPICDIVVRVGDTVIIIEAKRDHSHCTAQLYNQAYNIALNNGLPMDETVITPFDLNWKKLMSLTTRVLAFEKTFNDSNRFTTDFVNLVKGHNPHWLPETPIANLAPSDTFNIRKRLHSALNSLDILDKYTKLTYNDRMGLVFTQPWSQEVIFSVDHQAGNLVIATYPGNTKGQGSHIFNRNLNISDQIKIKGVDYKVHVMYHIKLTSFRKFFTGLMFSDQDLTKSDLYSLANFQQYTGRKLRDTGDWDKIAALFDEYFNEEFNWRKHMKWNELVINSGKSQFDISFGYELAVVVPFQVLKQADTSPTNLDGLMELLEECYKAFEKELLKQ